MDPKKAYATATVADRETALGNTRNRLTNILRDLESIKGRISEFNGRTFGHPVSGVSGPADSVKASPGAIPSIFELLDEVESVVGGISVNLEQVETLA